MHPREEKRKGTKQFSFANASLLPFPPPPQRELERKKEEKWKTSAFALREKEGGGGFVRLLQRRKKKKGKWICLREEPKTLRTKDSREKRGEKSPFLYAAPPVREREVRREALFFFPSSFCGAILYPPPPPPPPLEKKGCLLLWVRDLTYIYTSFSLKATIVYFRKTNGLFLFFIRPSLPEKRKKRLPFPFLPLFYFGFVCTHLPLPFPLYERRKRRKEKKSGGKTEEEEEWPLCPLSPPRRSSLALIRRRGTKCEYSRYGKGGRPALLSHKWKGKKQNLEKCIIIVVLLGATARVISSDRSHAWKSGSGRG